MEGQTTPNIMKGRKNRQPRTLRKDGRTDCPELNEGRKNRQPQTLRKKGQIASNVIEGRKEGQTAPNLPSRYLNFRLSDIL